VHRGREPTTTVRNRKEAEKMKLSKVLGMIAAFAMLVFPALVSAQFVVVDPMELNFGDVETYSTAELTLAVSCAEGSSTCAFQTGSLGTEIMLSDDAGGAFTAEWELPEFSEFRPGDPPVIITVRFYAEDAGE
jgi:hypothetical protein